MKNSSTGVIIAKLQPYILYPRNLQPVGDLSSDRSMCHKKKHNKKTEMINSNSIFQRDIGDQYFSV